MSERIGYYICHCGINIASKVRCEEVAAYVATLPGVVVSRDYLFTCSDPGQEIIERDIRELGLTRVVVASCSPRMHEETFRGATARAGLNPFEAFHHVCVREHVSWVHPDEDEATEKAKVLSRAGIQRVLRQRKLLPAHFHVNPNTLVIGGGIAGMQAALDIASAGFKVYLVEKEPTLGGHMLQYDKTFPTLDCAACIGTPKMVSVGQHKNIELLSYAEVEDFSGFVGNYKVKVRKKARYVDAKKCTGCGDCARVCPVEKPNEWDVGTRLRNAVYRPFPQAVPVTYLIEKHDRAPCVQACPAGTNVQGYVALIKAGKYLEAVQLIMERLPFPGTLGRVCPAPCEAQCRRKELEQPLAIRCLKRFAADQVDWEELPVVEPTEKHPQQRVAVIGSGPAGLSAAYFLARMGYPVTVFEAQPVAGGMMRSGIPDYRLPPKILEQEIDYIRRLGVDIRLNTPIGARPAATDSSEDSTGTNLTVDDLFSQGFQAVFVAAGLTKSARLGLEGEDAEGIIPGIEFLKQVNLSGAGPDTARRVPTSSTDGGAGPDTARRVPTSSTDDSAGPDTARRVPTSSTDGGAGPDTARRFPTVLRDAVVIGGGAVAMDVARSARRLGAQRVRVYCLEARDQMPAWEDEIRGALLEDIEIYNGWGPNRFKVEEGRVTGVEFKRCTRVFDEQKRFSPEYDEADTCEVTCENVLVAIGQAPDTSWARGSQDLPLGPRGFVKADPKTFATEREGLFAGGELYSGPSIVIQAVANGHEAAISIDRYLRGEDLVENRPTRPSGERWSPIPDYVKEAERAEVSLLAKEARAGFEEVERVFSEEQARTEAARCIACGTCSECMLCVESCEAKAIDHQQTDELVELEVGSVIVATGFDAMDPTPLKQYGYGTYPNVLTNLEFERLSNATGPTGGRILKRNPENLLEFTEPPSSVAILHCIGSRDVRYHPYCSRTCCMYALKYAHLLKDRVGHEVEVYNFYIDMRCFGKGYEEFYQRTQSEGVRMIRGRPARITDRAESEDEAGRLVVIVEDTASQRLLRVPVDMAILCTAMEARKDATSVARTFGITIGNDGFFLEEHPKLEPVSTSTAGVFIAGACQGPKDIPDSVAQAKAAAAMALALSSRGEVEVSPMISAIDPDLCIGCQVCIDLCPYSAIEFDSRHLRSVVNSAVCKGCGSCAGYCPSGAAKVGHFTDEQILDEIEGLLGRKK